MDEADADQETAVEEMVLAQTAMAAEEEKAVDSLAGMAGEGQAMDEKAKAAEVRASVRASPVVAEKMLAAAPVVGSAAMLEAVEGVKGRG